MPCVRPPNNNQKLGGFLFLKNILQKVRKIKKNCVYLYYLFE